MAELEKIKKERAEEQERKVRDIDWKDLPWNVLQITFLAQVPI